MKTTRLGIIMGLCSFVFSVSAQTIEEKPFSLTPTYKVKDEDGRLEYTYKKKPFSLNDTWEIQDEVGRKVGEIEERPFSLHGTWEHKDELGRVRATTEERPFGVKRDTHMDPEKTAKLADMKLSRSDMFERCKEDLALMILLWKELKSMPPEGDWMYASLMSLKFAEAMDVRDEYEKLSKDIPKLKIVPM